MAWRTLAVALVTLTFVDGAARAGVEDPAADWNQVLGRFVDGRGFVDYAGLAAARAPLDRYVAWLATTSPDSAPALFPAPQDRLAYWLNAYNALVIRGVLERGIDTPSVWGDGLFGIGFFTARSWTLGGSRISLKKLEDDVVRGRFHDPRVHAALNCASVGCPRLPQRAFEGATLDAELDAAMRTFVGETRNCTVDRGRGVVVLSKIFDWFGDDFVDYERAQGTPAPTVVDYVNRYRSLDDQVPPGLRVEFRPYDKRLNRQGTTATRTSER